MTPIWVVRRQRGNNPEDHNLNNFPMAEIFALLGCYKAQIGSNYSVLG